MQPKEIQLGIYERLGITRPRHSTADSCNGDCTMCYRKCRYCVLVRVGVVTSHYGCDTIDDVYDICANVAAQMDLRWGTQTNCFSVVKIYHCGRMVRNYKFVP